MARTSIYLPDSLSAKVKEHGLPFSAICQAALSEAVARAESDEPMVAIDAALAQMTALVAEAKAALAYFEWSATPCSEACRSDCHEHDDPKNPLTWAKSNPGLGIRVNLERIEREFHDPDQPTVKP